MSERCPECDAPLAVARPGTTVACPRCRNPVLVVARPGPGDPDPVEMERATPSVVRAPAESPPAARWGMVAVALAVIAVAHLGLWLLLTAAARSRVAEAQARYDASEMEEALAEEPAGPRTPPGAAVSDAVREEAARRQLAAQQRLEMARVWATDRQHVALVGYALLGAFLLQAGLVVLMKVRSSSPPRRERATRGAG